MLTPLSGASLDPMIAGIFRCGRGTRAGLQAVAILHVGSYSFCFSPIHGYRQISKLSEVKLCSEQRQFQKLS
ncbi:hypothetical protein CapIbe_010990 [Capra ibex]